MSDEQPSGGTSGQRAGEEIGTLAEEAAKLLGALSGWAQQHQEQGGAGLGDLAAGAVRAVKDVNEHLANTGPECTYCPICRVMHLVRETNPEVRAHLSVAASSLLQAAAGVLTQASSAGASDPTRPAGVERVDLDADG